MSLRLCAQNNAATPAPATSTSLADLAQHSNLWPAQVTLLVPVKMVILSNGKEVGAITSPDGSIVDLVAVGATGLQVRVMQATATVPAEQTDLWQRVSALSAKPHTAAVAPPPPAPAPSPAPPPAPPAPPSQTPAPASAAFATTSDKPLQFDYEVKPRDNFAKAIFRFWSPAYKDPIRGIIVLVPGTNGDGRGMADNGDWQAMARKYRLALVGVFFKGTEGSDYCNVTAGSGQALFDALQQFSVQSNHPEIAQAPLALYGESAGGQFNYNFTLWKPERIICFVVNKGGYYSQEGSSPPARAVPGLFILGLSDAGYRITAVTDRWTEGRERGALWALARQPHSGHEFSRTAALARSFFEPIFKERLPDESLGSIDGPALKPIDETQGWLGDLTSNEIHDGSTDGQPNHQAAWFPDQNSAAAWKNFVSK